MVRLATRAALCLAAAWMVAMPALAQPLRIVAVGASNTSGFYLGKDDAYPAQLEKLLIGVGINAEVINAGEVFDTTAGMLRRIDRDVPPGTDIVILQPGANDLRFFGSYEQRVANLLAMEQKLRARNIAVLVYDDEIPLRYYTWDFIHLTRAGHMMIAEALLPRILALIGRPRPVSDFHEPTR